MSSDRYARVQINDLFLTSDGTAAGVWCRTRVENEAAFASSLAVNTVLSVDATPLSQILDRSLRGIPFTVVIEYCPESLLESLIAAFNAALISSGTVRVVCDSLTDFDVEANIQPQNGALYTWESRSGGIVKGVRFKFISAGAES